MMQRAGVALAWRQLIREPRLLLTELGCDCGLSITRHSLVFQPYPVKAVAAVEECLGIAGCPPTPGPAVASASRRLRGPYAGYPQVIVPVPGTELGTK